MIEEHSLVAPGLDYLARIVHAADIAEELDSVPEGRGFKAIADAFTLSVESDVERQRLQWPIYDALLEWCARREEHEA